MEGTVGEIRMFTGNSAPENWAFCHGHTLATKDYPDLFQIIRGRFGGNGQTTFGLPDLRGRRAVGEGTTNDFIRGNHAGREFHQLTLEQMPRHQHKVNLSGQLDVGLPYVDDEPNTEKPFDASYAANEYLVRYNNDNDSEKLPMGTASIELGSDIYIHKSGVDNPEPIDLRVPYAVTHFIICIKGALPLR